MKAGEVVFSSEPFAYVLCNSERGLLCDFCLTRNEDLKKCTRCSFAFYCNKTCQRQAWVDHKAECLSIKKVSPKIPTDFVRLTARILRKLQSSQSKKSEATHNGSVRRFDDLMSHRKSILQDSDRLNQFVVYKEVLTQFLNPTNVPDAEDLFELFGKVVINTFDICDGEMHSVGVGLYLGASTLDHSCCPNANILFQGTRIDVRLLEDISDKTEAFISYIDILATTEERKKQLKTQYYFDCNCPRCQDQILDSCMTSICCVNKNCEEPILQDENLGNEMCKSCGTHVNITQRRDLACEIMKSSEILLTTLKEYKKTKNYEKLLSEAEVCLEMQKPILHDLNIFRIRILDMGFDAAIEVQQWDKAINFGESTLNGYRKYYGKIHPNLGLQLMKLGKLHLFRSDFLHALHLLEEAKTVLSVTHTTDHPLYSSLCDMAEQCKMSSSLNKRIN